MKHVFLVKRTDTVSFQEYISFICIADDEKQARAMHPANEKFGQDFGAWISFENINTLEIEYIGIAATHEVKSRIVLAYYLHG